MYPVFCPTFPGLLLSQVGVLHRRADFRLESFVTTELVVVRIVL